MGNFPSLIVTNKVQQNAANSYELSFGKQEFKYVQKGYTIVYIGQKKLIKNGKQPIYKISQAKLDYALKYEEMFKKKEPSKNENPKFYPPYTPPQHIARPPNSAGESSNCLLYTSPSPRDRQKSRMPSSA
eukprot:TRINITY_DN21085_c0_g1_i1.p3 TRINITY_DN21085_c0_g1~~TRINITY_DN21085_c0_g1_i1.p3  ORF type:complete len:130 (+),score=22.39 TRINITY_DN21085_c0_g1_i1:76-465(+)